MRIDLLHVSLSPRKQRDLFGRGERAPSPSKEEWLREIFSQEIQFTHQKEQFYFVPETAVNQDTVIPRGQKFVAGRIGRKTISTENEPPEARLNPIMREVWHASAVVIDPQPTDPDGQRVAMEFHPTVGDPAAVFDSLCDAINALRPPEFYNISSKPIFDDYDFWKFVNDNKDDINYVRFDLLAPNMFDITGDIGEGIRTLEKHERIQSVGVELRSNDALELESERLGNLTEYVSKGGGSLRARTRTGKRFNSKRKSKHQFIKDEKTDKDKPPSTLQRISRIIGSVF